MGKAGGDIRGGREREDTTARFRGNGMEWNGREGEGRRGGVQGGVLVGIRSSLSDTEKPLLLVSIWVRPTDAQ